MVITWHGDTCFSIKEKNTTVLMDPFKEIKNCPKKADVVMISDEERERADLEEAGKAFDWPGEYEAREIPILAFQCYDRSLSDEESGEKGKQVLIFRFEMNDITFCHLGNIGHVLKSDLIEQLGDIDVLMINASENTALPAKKAHEIIEQIDPRSIVLMGDGTFDAFLKETDKTLKALCAKHYLKH